jgi:sugar phosphate isomerase/epimerase
MLEVVFSDSEIEKQVLKKEGEGKVENSSREELTRILTKFAESGWDLIAGPSKAWLDGNGDEKELLAAIEQADKDCGSCGCEFDPLYKRAIALLKTA